MVFALPRRRGPRGAGAGPPAPASARRAWQGARQPVPVPGMGEDRVHPAGAWRVRESESAATTGQPSAGAEVWPQAQHRWPGRRAAGPEPSPGGERSAPVPWAGDGRQTAGKLRPRPLRSDVGPPGGSRAAAATSLEADTPTESARPDCAREKKPPPRGELPAGRGGSRSGVPRPPRARGQPCAAPRCREARGAPPGGDRGRTSCARAAVGTTACPRAARYRCTGAASPSTVAPTCRRPRGVPGAAPRRTGGPPRIEERCPGRVPEERPPPPSPDRSRCWTAAWIALRAGARWGFARAEVAPAGRGAPPARCWDAQDPGTADDVPARRGGLPHDGGRG